MDAQAVPRFVISGVGDKDSFSFSGPGRTTIDLVSGKRLRRFDLTTGRPIGDPAGREFPDPILAVSPDGALVVTAAPIADRPRPTWSIRRFEADSMRLRVQLPAWECAYLDGSMIFDPGGRYVGLKENPFTTDSASGLRACRFWRLDMASPVGPPRGVTEDWQQPETRFVPVKGGRAVLAYVNTVGRMRFWDLDADRPLDRIEPEPSEGPLGSTEARASCGFDGTNLVCVLDSGLVRWRDPASGRLARPDWRPHRARRGATLMGDGRTMLVVADDDRVRWYDLASGLECGPAPRLKGWKTAPQAGDAGDEILCPQGSFLLARRGDRLIVWQVPTPLRPSQPNAPAARGPAYLSAAHSRAGGEFVVGDAQANGSAMGLEEITRYGAGQNTTKGRAVAGRFDAESGRPLGAPLYPMDNHPCYSPDGRLIAGCRTQDFKGGQFQATFVAAWDRTDGRSVLPWTEVPQFVHALTFAPDGTTLAVGAVAGTWLFDLSGRRPPSFLRQPGPIARLEFRPDGRRQAAGSRHGWDGSQPGVRLWDPHTAAPVGPLFPTTRLPFFRFTPEGRALVVLDVARRGIVRIDPADGRPTATAVGLSGPGASPADGGRPDGATASLAFGLRPDGEVIAESPGSTVARQYEVRTGRPLGPPLSHPAPVCWLACAPDGATLASACADGSIQFWDAPTGQPLGPSRSLGSPTLGLDFGPDGAQLTAVTVEGRAASWPVPRPVPTDDPALLRLRAETITGLRSGTEGELTDLAAESWQVGRERLARAWPEAATGPDGRAALESWSRERADDARRVDDLAAHRYNLGRLAELRPADWLPPARRAASFSDAGLFAAAEAEYARAARLVRPAELTSWYWSRGVGHLASGRADVAAWYLGRVAAARPDDWRVHAQRAEADARRGLPAAAGQERAIALGADPAYIAEVADDHASRGDWSDAARLLTIAADRGRAAPADLALVCLKRGDRPGYRRACASLLATLDPRPDAWDAALQAAHVVGLAPDAVDDYARPLALASSALDFLAGLSSDPVAFRAIRRDAHRARAEVLFRAGRHPEALAELSRAAVPGEADLHDDLLVALVRARMGHRAEAKARLDRVRQASPPASARLTDWRERFAFELLEAEAEAAVLDAGFPADAFAR